MTKWVYNFGAGQADGRADLKVLLGGKGANLAEMSNLGLPVPPGFTITTEVCTYFYKNGENYPGDLKPHVEAALKHVGELADGRFGDPRPLLVSVRSGARASMPGMMDTVLNLGLNPDTVAGLARQTGDERFAYDSYRRFIQMYSGVVLEVDHSHFEEILENEKEDKGVELDTDLDAADWKRIAELYKAKVKQVLGKPFPDDVNEQLWCAIGAVFGSWMGARAKTYRRLNNIPEDWGTAVNVQAMVFGNRGATSATGVAFTRDPSTGEAALYGEFLINAQGEDVVAGIRTPQSITKRARLAGGSKRPSMEEAMPEAFGELSRIASEAGSALPRYAGRGIHGAGGQALHAPDAVRQAHGKGGLAHRDRDGARRADQRRRGRDAGRSGGPRPIAASDLDPNAPKELIASGLAASPGAASGEAVFTADEAEHAAGEGRDVILVRLETSPEDIHGMHAAKGILTVRGGMTSHAAVVARGMGRPCVTGAGELKVDTERGVMNAGAVTISRGDIITIDGAAGKVYRGRVATLNPEVSGDFAHADGMGRCAAAAEDPRQCRYAGRLRDRAALWRRRGGALPHRAYVLRCGAHSGGAPDDSGRRCGGAQSRARQAPSHAARRFPQDFSHHGGAAGNHKAARSAPARIHSAFR